MANSHNGYIELPYSEAVNHWILVTWKQEWESAIDFISQLLPSQPHPVEHFGQQVSRFAGPFVWSSIFCLNIPIYVVWENKEAISGKTGGRRCWCKCMIIIIPHHIFWDWALAKHWAPFKPSGSQNMQWHNLGRANGKVPFPLWLRSCNYSSEASIISR